MRPTHLLQEGSSRRLAQHCGLPWHDAMLRFYETDRTVQTASQLQVRFSTNQHVQQAAAAPGSWFSRCAGSGAVPAARVTLTCACAVTPPYPCLALWQVKKPIYTSSLDKWHAYKDGLAPLLLQASGHSI